MLAGEVRRFTDCSVGADRNLVEQDHFVAGLAPADERLHEGLEVVQAVQR